MRQPRAVLGNAVRFVLLVAVMADEQRLRSHFGDLPGTLIVGLCLLLSGILVTLTLGPMFPVDSGPLPETTKREADDSAGPEALER